MNTNKVYQLSRRDAMKVSLLSTAGLLLAACSIDGEGSEAQLNYVTATPQSTAIQLEPTPQCDDHDETPSQTEGPFYTADTPERTNLREDGLSGTPLVVRGKVLTTDCQPIAGAVLDFWHTDDAGIYDNEGYRLRGHQFTDVNGNFYLETIMPGLYPGRTRHIHVKAQGPDTALLTTQLYFPGEPENDVDSIFEPMLIMDMVDEGGSKSASFNFVLS